MSTFDIQKFYDNNVELIRHCNCLRESLVTKPTQSDFRVYCLLIAQSSIDSKLSIILGTNSEPGNIDGSICAERAAIVQLRHSPHLEVKKVVITTDSIHTVSPGLLCREFLMSNANKDFIVVLGNCDGSIITEGFLGQLFPFPYHYRYQLRKDLISFASLFASSLNLIDDNNKDMKLLFDAAMKVNKYDKLDKLHPIRLSAAVMFGNNDIQVAWQLKGLEYGCSLDPVTQLIHEMERRKIAYFEEFNDDSPANNELTSYSFAKYIIMVDQFGVAHAPFARARALLFEHGYGDVQVIVHSENKTIEIINASSLYPQLEGFGMLSDSDFSCL